ncbi:MAG TPA: GNAT family N-acetyltransferase [Thermoanaerobaculia bacterium]|nr:GNAT family N-acetyltransferase [Thermoanaerobaculia bacterium]
MSNLDPSTLTVRCVADCTSAEAAAAITRSFEGYFVPLQFTPQAFERRFRGEHLDPFASKVYLRDGEVAGVLLVSRRGWTSRISAMGLVPESRGQGLGKWVMEEAIREARERGERAMLLEVIEENERAFRLYAGLGFRTLRRLIGYRRPTDAGPASPDVLTEIDPLDFARVAAREGEPDLPWMISPETLAAAASPARAWRLGEQAYALVGNPDADPIPLTALVVPREHRRQGWGSRLVRALTSTLPRRAWVVSPVLPEDLASELFARLGWERHFLSQLEMRLDLPA